MLRWACAASVVAGMCALGTLTAAQSSTPMVPEWRLVPAARILLPGRVDSNSPVFWSLTDGTWRLNAVTSWAGTASVSTGARLDRLLPGVPVAIADHPGDGVWMESVVVDTNGDWYGYYHNEVPAVRCGRPDRQVPQILAARSRDHGRSWSYVGVVLEAPASSVACGSSNPFVLGGVGDVSAVLDHDRQHLLLYFTQYASEPARQGIGVARLAWADRDAPAGKVTVWTDGAWLPARPLVVEGSNAARWEYPLGTPLVPATQSWHDGVPAADAFWGASLHWNTYLEQWVMLVNRARDERFNQDGIYIAFNRTLADPRGWSAPQKLRSGGGWYAQVVGTEPREGADTRAGQRARFFITGRSQHVLEFLRR